MYDVITKKTIAYWQKIDAYHFIFLLNSLSDSSLRGTVIFCFNSTRYIMTFITKITQMLIKLVLWMLRQFLSSCEQHQSGTENYLNADYEISVSNMLFGIIGIIGNYNCKLKNY